MANLLSKKITSLPYISSQHALLLAQELNITTLEELIYFFPFRYEDRTTWHSINEIDDSMPYVQCKGRLGPFKRDYKRKKKTLLAPFRDESGLIWLVWFQKVHWMQKHLQPNTPYAIFGRPTRYRNKLIIAHPEVTPLLSLQKTSYPFQPIYHSTQQLTKGGLPSKGITRLIERALATIKGKVKENLPPDLMLKYGLIPHEEALHYIHFPPSSKKLAQAKHRLKFEEIFYLKMRLSATYQEKHQTSALPFSSLDLVNAFYKKLPFPLTKAQKKVIREIYADMSSGRQMNRFLQGDVGSGKTIVAFIAMLLPLAHGKQVALMVPTEVLAKQHYSTLTNYAASLSINIGLLTGSTPKRERKQLQEALLSGDLHILIGTHALIQASVQFQALGLVIIDEKHRFGVAQRATLWQKGSSPHLLIISATPLPRTLSMVLYSHLATSTIDELPPYRKPVKTYHAYDADRLRLFGFLRKKITQGAQAYIIYPRIEEGKEALKDLYDGYESMTRAFPDQPISILHGRMLPKNKAYEIDRFARGETKIMVATTVIEVGINIPKATLMVIENAETFGLAQLHQLRGRIMRSEAQAYCILMSKDKLTPIQKARMQAIVKNRDGFRIADLDLELRGPGDLDGLAQSGFLSLRVVNLAKDGALVKSVSQEVTTLWNKDPNLIAAEHQCILDHMAHMNEQKKNWTKIS